VSDPLIACHCNAICDRTVMAAIADGADSVDDLGRSCGAGARCGGCHDVLDTLLAAVRAVEEAFGSSSRATNFNLREAAYG